MASKNIRDQKSAPRGGKPAKPSGELQSDDLDKVAGGMSTAGGLPTGKRGGVFSSDPCEGGE